MKVVQGVILTDQIRGVDWKERRAERAGVVSDAVLTDVQELLQKLIAG